MKRIRSFRVKKVCSKMIPCLFVLSALLPFVTPAGSFNVEVVTNITQVSEGGNFFIRCIVYGIPALHFLDSSNASVDWIFQTNNRVVILGQFPKRFYQPKYEIQPDEWNITSVDNTLQNAINLTIVINEVTERDKGIYTCVVSMGSEVVRRTLNLTDETASSSLVFIDYAVPREEADKRCSFYGFKTLDNKATEHELSSIMQSNETVWTLTVDDKYVVIKHRQWLSIRGCHHINLTHNGELHHNCNLVFDSPDNMMSSYIGIHNTSCYVIPENIKEFEKKQLPESLCNWRCTDVIETSCGGTEAISLYKVIDVTYKNFSGFKPSHEEQCNALYLPDVELPYQRIACQNTSTCSTLCLQSIRNKTDNKINVVEKYRDTSSTEWMKAWESCAEHSASLPDERGNFSYNFTEFLCLGIIKSSQLIFKEKALGVLSKKGNDSIVLEYTTERKEKFPFICELLIEPAAQRNDSDESKTTNNFQADLMQVSDSFDMLIIIIPSSFLGLVILLTVIICVTIRLKKTKSKEKITSEEPKDDVAMKAVLTNEKEEPKDDVTMRAVVTNEKEEPEEYDVLRQHKQTTNNDDDLYDHAKEESSGIYDVTIRDQSLLHDNTMTDNLYDSRIKTAIKLDNFDIDLYDDPKRTGRDTYGIPTTLHNVTQLTDSMYGHVKEN